MDHKEAITVLQNLAERLPLEDREKEAIATAIGVLSWSTLSKSRIKALKARRDKSAEW